MKNLTAQIVILAEQLRQQGFHKHADDLEAKFLLAKQAEAKLYEVFKETGDDLVHSAHPEGGVEMEPAKDDGGVVETILEQKEKIEKAVAKVPTGKLAAKQLVALIKSV
jgi:adenine C2-methylase RlmN of 23S rRNA A2503 and tRNA A37